MNENDSLSIYFYIYAALELILTFLAAYLLKNSVNVVFLIFVIQLLLQGAITFEGKKSERYPTYRMYMGGVVPFIMVTFMLWYNTF